jgi:ribosomal protein L11
LSRWFESGCSREQKIKMKSTIKLQIEATKASMQPPIGPILGQYGIPRAKFCQDFNEQTKIYEEGTILSVKLKLYKKKVININWSPLTRRNLKKLQYNSSDIISKDLRNNITKKDISIIHNVNEEERVLDQNNKLLNVSFRQKFERWMKYNKYRKMIRKLRLNSNFERKKRIKTKRKKKRRQILEYNYMYIEDVYNLACSSKLARVKETIGNIELNVKLRKSEKKEKEKRAIKEILGSLTSMQTYIINKNAAR